MSEGRKDDSGKDPWHLAPWDAFRAITKVLAFGAAKYGERNWEKGMAWSRPYSALIRHMTAWWEEKGVDEDTGYSHLWHAGCCICFLIAYELRGIGEDDREQYTPNTPRRSIQEIVHDALCAQEQQDKQHDDEIKAWVHEALNPKSGRGR